eukprot:12629091-Alexandrium_andersonii.AAC.1
MTSRDAPPVAYDVDQDGRAASHAFTQAACNAYRAGTVERSEYTWAQWLRRAIDFCWPRAHRTPRKR